MVMLLVSCSATQLVQQESMPVAFITVHHSKLLIPENATYQWSDGFMRHSQKGLISNVDMWELLKQSIEQELNNKGYRHTAEAEHADLNISFIAALASTLGDKEIASRYGLVPGLMVHSVDKNRYEKGTLIFDVLNPETGQLVWRTAGQALAVLEEIPLADRKARIDVFVKKLLAFLPEK
ncbi:conserved hypothetical protein [Bathymodiolus platifrons methanotrophic gill symbiont]|uniref:DUF4136 domain-containing protein n=2 Tax=Bathymodiolus platifrons methanotrophic gill symbiont TaxID=113268 RepID=UPI000B736A89|nr:DUF4136 domain-containing protein [Bathymodiolus platifrons methanotrophic gill symbiont]TXL06133.1 hypothetical protein BMR09_08780 [Methylococcaceae bacterium CS3]GAW86549.1 conserved hypothetical protein [Bathymodiolus platifrons methanotrophic gill symbiont]GFO77690.1 hypothetical protein BPLS_P6284 [Bathymodiolus platifrons methanotrophic gill symbiont]